MGFTDQSRDRQQSISLKCGREYGQVALVGIRGHDLAREGLCDAPDPLELEGAVSESSKRGLQLSVLTVAAYPWEQPVGDCEAAGTPFRESAHLRDRVGRVFAQRDDALDGEGFIKGRDDGSRRWRGKIGWLASSESERRHQ